MITFFHAQGSRTIKAFNEAVSSDLMPRITKIVAFQDTRPKKGDLILKAGEGSASITEERYAWRLGGYIIYVPECSDCLMRCVRQAVENGTDLVMVDAALASTKQLSGAK